MAAMETQAEVFEPLELRYSDLVLLSSSRISSSSLSCEELERIEFISGGVMRALGPSGPGLLAITGVPKAPAFRRGLLPLARKLALLGKKERAQVLKDIGLGSDVSMRNLDRAVSSFAMQLKYEQFSNLESVSPLFNNGQEDIEEMQKRRTVDDWQGFHGHEQQLIGNIFRELGLCMMELGFQLAQVCDNLIGGKELGQSILDAGTAKGRLIHYHSVLDNLLLKEENKRTKGSISKARPTTSSVINLPNTLSLTNLHVSASSDNKVLPNFMKNEDEQFLCGKISTGVSCRRKYFSNLWQQWHYDYGIFTVLTSPLFMSSCGLNDSFCFKDCSSPDEHTYLQLYDSNNDRVLLVKASPESFIIQVGESADILSNGKLRSTLHSVGRPSEIESLSRETFVVFLQPPWNKVLPIPSYLMDAEVKDEEHLASNDACLVGHMVGSGDSNHIVQEIFRSIPPLSSRLRRGMTFAEFSRETTKQYYGGGGTQSGRQ
ncbi:hypothetical protein M5K25_005545 [Dendrobium thyrsiflorum]|uniref:Isopenicillin N synthase-like Fe(2+) 2OG dioxygenase domain-containing protein n=1 Tax=Dendrobium thyrsiflorum TaxID=117978 RepID=A0ABD0VIZ0_DENTH